MKKPMVFMLSVGFNAIAMIDDHDIHSDSPVTSPTVTMSNPCVLNVKQVPKANPADPSKPLVAYNKTVTGMILFGDSSQEFPVFKDSQIIVSYEPDKDTLEIYNNWLAAKEAQTRKKESGIIAPGDPGFKEMASKLVKP